MNNFGKLKTMILNKLTESYSTQNKKDIKNIIKLIKEDKDLKDLYLFYEEIEKTTLDYPGSAELYLETVEPLLVEKNKNARKGIKKLLPLLEGVNSNENELYDLLDIISEKTELKNIDKKVIAKKKLIEHLSTPKTIEENYMTSIVPNETLLHTVLANNFNLLYNETLNEDDKESLRSIISMSDDDIEKEMIELKESIIEDVSKLLNESTDSDFNQKLENVKIEVNSMSKNKYNYYRLKQLKNGLN